MRGLRSQIVAAALLASAPSFADGAPPDAARKHFDDGKRLFREGKQEASAAKLDQACGEFKAAYALRATKNVLWNVIVCEVATKKSLDAMKHLRAYVKANGTPARGSDAARELAEQWDPTYAATGHLLIEAPEGAEVTIEGAAVEAPLPGEVDVSSGVHAVEAKLGERRAKTEVAVLGGQTAKVKLAFAAPLTVTSGLSGGPASSSGEPPLPVPHDEAPHVGNGEPGAARVVTVAAVGAGAVASFALAIGFRAGSSSAGDRASGLRAGLGDSACTAASANPACADLHAANDDARRDATLSTVFLVSGMALTAAAAGTFFFWPRGSVARSVWMAPVWRGAAGGFSF